MITKFKQLESEFHLGKATIIIACFTLLSRVLGFVRDLLLASQLGLSHDSDVYFTAFRLPDTVYNLLILGTLSVAFIPVFSKYYLKDKPHAFRLASTVLNLAGTGMIVVCALLFIFVEPLTKLIAPGFSDSQLDQTASITRLMLISPIIFTLSNAFSSVLISLKKFIIVNTAPLLYNVGIIFGIIFLFPRFGLRGLAYGVLLGALMHLGIQIPEAIRNGFRWKPVLNWNDPGIKQIARLFLPRIFGLDISYINLVIVSIVGSTLVTGSITAFNYANNIQAVALGIFALSTAIAIFPVLSELYAKDDEKEFIGSLQRSIIRVMFFIIPTIIFLLLFRAHIVRLLLGYGRCDWNCTIITFNTLGVLAFGLIGQSLVPLFARAFYARHNTKTPVVIGLLALVMNAVLSYFLARGLGVTGIALGFVMATTLNAILLLGALHRRLYVATTDQPSLMKSFDTQAVAGIVKILMASIIMGGVSYIMLYVVEPFLNTRTVIGIFLQVAISGSVGAFVYLRLAHHLKLAEAEQIFNWFWKMVGGLARLVVDKTP